MTDPTNFLDVVSIKVGALIGAVCSLKYIKGTWYEKALMVVFACYVGNYGYVYVADKTGIPLGISAILLGFLSAAVADKLMETVQSNDVWIKLREKAGL